MRLLPLLAVLGCTAPNGASDLDASAERLIAEDGITLRSGRWMFDGATAEEAARAVLPAGAFTLEHQRVGLVGTWFRFAQRVDGLRVADGEVIVAARSEPGGAVVRQMTVATRALGDWTPPTSAVPEAEARQAAAEAVGGLAIGAERIVLADAREVVWRVDVRGLNREAWQVDVHANTAEVVNQRDRRQFVDGTGQVFDPSPMASSGDYSLINDRDRDYAALTAELVTVTLPRLDGSGFLRGDFVEAQPLAANETNLSFFYNRADDRFEEVMAYFHATRTQERIQALGFTDVNNRMQVFDANGSRQDNSWYDPQTLEITLGYGGVDDGEDADIILHEYGHAIQDDQVPNWGTSPESGAMGEGFGDYLALSFASTFTPGLPDPNCLAEWDGVSISNQTPPCLRRIDEDLHYPERLIGGWNDVHEDGQIWSNALWRARAAIGVDVMDTLVLEHHFAMPSSSRMINAGNVLLTTENTLYAGQYQDTLRRALIERGVSREMTASPNLPYVLRRVAVTLENSRSNNRYDDFEDETVTFTEAGAAGLRLHFTQVALETDSACYGTLCDAVYITDANGDLFSVMGGTRTPFDSVVIPGDTVNLRLVSDGSVGLFGYRIDRVDVMTDTCGDGDGDGVDRCNNDCDDTDATINPNATEICDGIDNDCANGADDGLSTDQDGDGYTTASSCAGSKNDCDDRDDTVYPNAPELCDDVDNDCDSATPDEDCDTDTDVAPDTDEAPKPGTPDDDNDAAKPSLEKAGGCGCDQSGATWTWAALLAVLYRRSDARKLRL